jgi:hypothetical protein
MTLDGAIPPNETAGYQDLVPVPGSVTSGIGTCCQVNGGLADAAANFRYSDFKRCKEWQKPVIPTSDRCTSFIEQCANGDVYDEEDALLKLDELFKEGCLSVDQYLNALRGLGSSS